MWTKIVGVFRQHALLYGFITAAGSVASIAGAIHSCSAPAAGPAAELRPSWQPAPPSGSVAPAPTAASQSVATSAAGVAPGVYLYNIHAVLPPDAGPMVLANVNVVESVVSAGPSGLVQNGNVRNINTLIDTTGPIVQNGQIENIGGAIHQAVAAGGPPRANSRPPKQQKTPAVGIGGNIEVHAGDNGGGATVLEHPTLRAGDGCTKGGDIVLAPGAGGPNGKGGDIVVNGGGVLQAGAGGIAPASSAGGCSR